MKTSKREELYHIIFKSDTKVGKGFDVVLLILICISIMAVILESVESIGSKYGLFLKTLEWVITISFTLEYVLRIVIVHKPWKYITSFYGIIDLLAVIPTYLGLFFAGSQSLMVIRAVRLLRIFRILKISRYTQAARLIGSSLRSSLVKIFVFLFAVITMVLIIGTIMYLVEGKRNGFVDIPTSIYWAVVTLTTVGYGNVVPVTALGQFISGLVMILGYGIIAVPTGIITAQVVSNQKRTEEIRNQTPPGYHEHGDVTIDCAECCENIADPDARYCKYCGTKLAD